MAPRRLRSPGSGDQPAVLARPAGQAVERLSGRRSSRLTASVAGATTFLLLLGPVGSPAFAAGAGVSGPGAGVAGAGAAVAGPGAGVAGAGDLQNRADQLAALIRQQGDRLERLAESVNQARIRLAAAESELARNAAQGAAADAGVVTATALVRRQGVAAYVRAEGPAALALPPASGAAGADDLVRRQAYAETIAGAASDAVSQLRIARRRLAASRSALLVDRRAAADALSRVERDGAAADAAQRTQASTLAGVQGQLADLVAASEARMAAAEAAQIQAAVTSRARTSGPVSPPGTSPTSPPTTTPHPTTVSTAPRGSTSSTTVRSTTTSTTSAPPTTVPPPPSGGPTPGSDRAIAAAEQQLGKPYEWGGAGPDAFDCSGLTMWAWAAAGVNLPHLAQAQYELTRRVPLTALLPGDLVFYGTPDNVHHVALYVGSGRMIEAPTTGEFVRFASIWRSDLLAGGRITR